MHLTIRSNELEEILRADGMEDETIPATIQLIRIELLDINNPTRMRSHMAWVDDILFCEPSGVKGYVRANKSSPTYFLTTLVFAGANLLIVVNM